MRFASLNDLKWVDWDGGLFDSEANEYYVASDLLVDGESYLCETTHGYQVVEYRDDDWNGSNYVSSFESNNVLRFVAEPLHSLPEPLEDENA